MIRTLRVVLLSLGPLVLLSCTTGGSGGLAPSSEARPATVTPTTMREPESVSRAIVRLDTVEQGTVQVAEAVHRPRFVSRTLPFTLKEVPRSAKLEMVVVGVEPACPLAAQPQGKTTLALNERPVSKFTLGPEGKGKAYLLAADLDPSILRVGENVLEVAGSACSFGRYEVVRFNGIVIAAE